MAPHISSECLYSPPYFHVRSKLKRLGIAKQIVCMHLPTMTASLYTSKPVQTRSVRRYNLYRGVWGACAPQLPLALCQRDTNWLSFVSVAPPAHRGPEDLGRRCSFCGTEPEGLAKGEEPFLQLSATDRQVKGDFSLLFKGLVEVY